jgi:glycosyltransferase involved in cell wall biosynthesis
MAEAESSESVDLTFVVIGYNEGPTLAACLDSTRRAYPPGMRCETIYVDGGSHDESLTIAQAAEVDQVLEADQQRRAAENRNVGWRTARGRFVQFVDGDMVLHPEWPAEALEVMAAHDDVAVVFGELREVRDNAFYRALQIDWQYPEGDALYCGGAALFRRAALDAVDGFPEDVRFGEEPLLCWRLRNEHNLRIYHRHAPMADHDLAYEGFLDYWRRNVRVGETYAEIAVRLSDTAEPFWTRECVATTRWGGLLFLSGLLLLAAPWPIRLGVAMFLVLLLSRKAWHARRRSQTWSVSLVYAGHTYFSKLGAAWGILRFRTTGNS